MTRRLPGSVNGWRRENILELDNCGSSQLDLLQRIGALPSEAIELFDYVEDVLLWMKNAAGHYHWVNRAFVFNFGLTHRSEFIGRTDFDICSLALANQYRLDDERVLKGERIVARVELVGRFDHATRWCATSKIPLHDQNGKIVGTAGVTYPLPGEPLIAESPLSQALRYISKNYVKSITHRDLAKVCGLSVRAFERQFLAAYHVSAHDYIRHLRVRMSCNALVFSRNTLAQVANEFGFVDQSHFTKEFRRFQGETPNAYRARFK
jgi:AraC-like DNA-binding protein